MGLVKHLYSGSQGTTSPTPYLHSITVLSPTSLRYVSRHGPTGQEEGTVLLLQFTPTTWQ